MSSVSVFCLAETMDLIPRKVPTMLLCRLHISLRFLSKIFPQFFSLNPPDQLIPVICWSMFNVYCLPCCQWSLFVVNLTYIFSDFQSLSQNNVEYLELGMCWFFCWSIIKLSVKCSQNYMYANFLNHFIFLRIHKSWLSSK